METRTCVLAALVAAAVALTAGAQPAGPRGVASSLRPEHRQAELTELKYFGAARGRQPVLAWQLRQDGEGQGGENNEEEEGGDNGGGGGGGGAGGGGGGGGGIMDSVVVNQPPPGASVAEARPVGLSIAGEGGVAASKPQATAVVGPGGLAVARPVATAIAGIPPGALLGAGPGGAQQYDYTQGTSGQSLAVGPGLAGPKYSVLPVGPPVGAPAQAAVRSPSPYQSQQATILYVPVYVR